MSLQHDVDELSRCKAHNLGVEGSSPTLMAMQGQVVPKRLNIHTGINAYKTYMLPWQ